MKTLQILGLAALLGCGSAFAANVTFAANGTFSDGSSLGGTLVINTASGIVQSNGLDLTVTGGTGSVNYVFDTLNSGGSEVSFGAGDDVWVGIDATDSAVSGPFLQLDLLIGSATDLVNYTGGALCYQGGATQVPAGEGGAVSNNCSSWVSFWNSQPAQSPSDPPLTGTSSSLTMATPEPAAIWLLAVPAVWLFRRQRQTAASR